MKTYTAFCQSADGTGTIWISALEAACEVAAMTKARSQCADEWGYDIDDVHCLGLAAGDVDILHWCDAVPD